MKHTAFYLKLFLFGSILMALGARAQVTKQQDGIQAKLIMSPNPSPYLSDWQSNKESITLTANVMQPYNQSVKLVAQLSLNGQVMARTKIESMPVLTLHQGNNTFVAADIIPLQSVSFTGEISQASQRSGMLPEGHYQICISFINAETNAPLASAPCQAFTILTIQPVTLIAPANGAEIARSHKTSIINTSNVLIYGNNKNGSNSISHVTAPEVDNDDAEVVFTWLPAMPQPPTPVQYRLRIVEVLPGQSPNNAILYSNTFFERDGLVSPLFTFADWLISDEYFKFTVRPTPPVYAWEVQAHDTHGNPIGPNFGKSKVGTFTIAAPISFSTSNLLANELPWDPKRKLGGGDFKGTPPKGSELSAESGVYFKTYFDSTLKKWVVVAFFDTQESWIKPGDKNDAALINHEQRHFDLAELFARKLRKKISELPKKDQTQNNIDKLAKETTDEMNKEQDKHDKDTEHGTNEEKQKEWNSNIDKGLEEYKAYAS